MATSKVQQTPAVDPGSLFYGELRNQLLQRRGRLQEAQARGQVAQAVRLLEEVDEALSRMEAGSFGICEQCHTSVEPDRLMADPLLRFCLDHLPPEKQRALEADLELAAKLQARLLPPKDFQCDGWRVAYHYQPAGIVSGDYCDLVIGRDNSLYFALGDVSGKGVAASLLMSNLSAMFRSLAPLDVPLGALMSHANRVFCESTLPTQYATVVVGKATSDGLVEMANAGHLEPLVVGKDSLRKINATGLPIGLFRDEPVKSTMFRMQPGEVLVLYSDGVSESRNAADTEYGAERLARIAADCIVHSPDEVVARCIADLATFRGSSSPTDDQTLMIVQRSAS
jgi:sigma-B regulation protein RsbU (phosphoserine phosphatase)